MHAFYGTLEWLLVAIVDLRSGDVYDVFAMFQNSFAISFW